MPSGSFPSTAATMFPLVLPPSVKIVPGRQCGAAVRITSAMRSTGVQTTTTSVNSVATVTVTEKEWAVSPDLTTVPAGDVTFVVNNTGQTDHELQVIKTDKDPKNLADIKSATKGSFGATALGLAIDRGLVKLDDLAQKYYPTLGTEKPSRVE